MKYNIYAIRDIKTGYLQPTVDMNDDSAIRNFEHAISNTSSLFYTHASDYSLYVIGEYDTETGVINSIDKYLLIEASDIKLQLKGDTNA